VNGGLKGGAIQPPLSFIHKAARIRRRPSSSRPARLLFLLLIAGVFAPPASAADRDAGGRKAVTCAACHGPEGNSTNPTVPSLAGQVPTYLHWQLLLYRDKRRADAQMTPIAAALSEADMADLAAFFSAQRPATPAGAPPAPARGEEGRRLAEGYHCNDCHGRDFAGRDYAPRLRGLSREYLLAQMRGFKARTRGDLDGTMTQAAIPVTDGELEPLVEYIGALR
jgi:cytochrome c553